MKIIFKRLISFFFLLSVLICFTKEKPDLDSYENSLRDLGEEEEKEDPMISTYKCQETGKVEIGDTVYLCIHLKEYKLRLHFKIEVDSSSTLDIAGGYYLAKQVATKADLKKNIKELSMVGQISQKFTKIPVTYYKNVPKENSTEEFDEIVFPVMNLVIKVKEGDITDIVWDNQCLGCESKNCVNDLKANNLYNLNEELTYSMCKADKIEEGFFDNDPKFYVTWFGTDKKGRQFKSSNLAFSKFKQYNTKSLYKAVGGSCGIIDTNKIYDGIVARDVNDILTKLNNTFTS